MARAQSMAMMIARRREGNASGARSRSANDPPGMYSVTIMKGCRRVHAPRYCTVFGWCICEGHTAASGVVLARVYYLI